MAFVGDAMLCDLLHCLPSELEREPADKVRQLHAYFGAKAQFAKRRQAEQQAINDLQRGY